MLVTFAVPTFAADETPEQDVNIKLTGDVPKTAQIDVRYGGNKVIFEDYQATQKTVGEQFELKVFYNPNQDVIVTVTSTKSAYIASNDTKGNYFEEGVGDNYQENYLIFGKGKAQNKSYLSIKGLRSKKKYDIEIKYTNKEIVDLIVVGGNEFTRTTALARGKYRYTSKPNPTLDKSFMNDNVRLEIDSQDKYDSFIRVYTEGGDSFTSDSRTAQFKTSGDTIVLVTFLKQGSTDEPLNLNFFNIIDGSIIINSKGNKDEYNKNEYYATETLDPSKFIAKLSDGNGGSAEIDKAIINQVGFNYKISSAPVAFKLEADSNVQLDSTTKESTEFEGFYDKGSDIKFTVTEKADKISKVYLSKAGVMEENPLEAQDGTYSFKIDADTKINVVYDEKVEENQDDTADAKVEELNLTAKAAGGNTDWQEITEVKELTLEDSGKVVALFDRDGQEVAKQIIHVNAEKPAEYSVEANSNVSDKVVKITTEPNGIDNAKFYQEGTPVTFRVPNLDLVKSVKIKVGGEAEKQLTKKESYTFPIKGNTVFTVEYEKEYELKTVKKLNGADTQEGGVVFDGGITKAKENDIVKFSVTPIANTRIKSVKVNDKDATKDGEKYSFTITEDATVTVEYISQVELTVNATEGGIILDGDTEPTTSKKFDKGTEVKFTTKLVDKKVIESVKVGGKTLNPDYEGVYTLNMDENKEVTLTYKDDLVGAKKQELKAKVRDSKDLSEAKKAEFNKAIDEESDLDKLNELGTQIDKAIDDAKKAAEKAAVDEAKKLVEKAEADKTTEAYDAAKEKVDALKDGEEKTALADRLAVVDKAIKDKAAKEAAEKAALEEATKLVEAAEKDKTEEAYNKASEAVKALKDGDAKTALEGRLDKVKKAIEDNKTAEQKAKELQEAKDAAKEEIKNLGYLSPEEKTAAENAIADATDKAGVENAVADAEKLNEKHQKEAEAEKALKKAKDAAKEEIDKLNNLNDDEKKAAQDKVDQADSKEAVEKALEAAQAQDKANADKKAVEDAKKAADEAQEAADEEKAKAEEAEKKAEDAEKAAEDAQAEADAKAKEAEEAKKAADEAADKAKEAQEAADKAKEAADADSNNEELSKAAEEAAEKAKEAQAEADAKAKEAEDAKAAAETAKATAEDAKAKADQAKEAAEEAKDAAEKAQEAADKAKAEAKEKENALTPTAEEKNDAKAIIENLPNLNPTEKAEFENKVDAATTKAQVEDTVKAAKAKDDENKNKKPEPQPQPGGDDEPSPEPYYPPYYPGYYYDEPYVPHTRDYSKKDDYKPAERREEKKEENKDTKGDILRVLYFYLDKGFYEMEVNGEIQQIPMDVQPMAINQRTMLPIRFVAEAIGATVEWHQDTQSATFTKDGITATIILGSNIIQVSDGRQIVLDAEPAVVDQRIFVPLTNISQIFGLTNGDLRDGNDNDIEWDQENYRVIITVRENQ